jgi:L-aminopeptidase/D-esterase-like protein
MQYLEEKRIGFEVGVARVPIVPAAILFDLNVGDARIRPDAGAGYAASKGAVSGPVAEGNVGAGAGASVGKLFGFARAMKGGVGSASIRLPGSAVVVAALVVVNAVGDVVDPADGRLIAGARTASGAALEDTRRALLEGRLPGVAASGESTTLGVVATSVKLGKAQAAKVAQMAHDGLARTVRPSHTPWDGDTLFALSTGGVDDPRGEMLVGSLAAEVVAVAVVRAIRAAKSLPGLPSAGDLTTRAPGSGG